ncbi:MAG: hypothetical protein NC079_01025 [Clostridium sp.]|nr:hypothetical protein [Acetatifactor muris]MCM1526070.1 hypothetical protein [Bacteroides sp.]MCM1562170.1 hypothetical protein [Clostridium sp.]
MPDVTGGSERIKQMDYGRGMNEDRRGPGGMPPCERCTFAGVRGVIVDIAPARAGEGRSDSCILYFTVEDENGNIVTFMVTPYTFVLDGEPLLMGTESIFWYRTDAPTVLIYPPQYTAVVAAPVKAGRMLDVSFYDDALVNEEHSLQLNLDRSVRLRATNGQYFMGNPANHNLVVSYTTSTRSIPAQTTPREVVVLCDELREE